jgi:hypothetical protein
MTTMATAARKNRRPAVATAIHHWAPRFVTNGGRLDFGRRCSISSWDDWCAAWSNCRHEEMGREALARSS